MCDNMVPEIKCTISVKDKLVKTLSRFADFGHFSESIETFGLELNTALTILIKDAGDQGADNVSTSDVSDSEDEEEKVKPKKKKKS